jgi:hypothetical protein
MYTTIGFGRDRDTVKLRKLINALALSTWAGGAAQDASGEPIINTDDVCEIRELKTTVQDAPTGTASSRNRTGSTRELKAARQKETDEAAAAAAATEGADGEAAAVVPDPPATELASASSYSAGREDLRF